MNKQNYFFLWKEYTFRQIINIYLQSKETYRNYLTILRQIIQVSQVEKCLIFQKRSFL